MSRYDASISPDAAAWQALDDQERMNRVREYHRDVGEALPDERQNELHAVAHVVVESQLALEVRPVPETLARLMREGLSRHAAVHAIGSVLMGSIYDGLSGNIGGIQTDFAKRLATLSAHQWLLDSEAQMIRAHGEPGETQ